MSKGQIRIVGAVAALSIVFIFTAISLRYIDMAEALPRRNQALFRSGLSAINAAISSGAIDDFIDGDKSPLLMILNNTLPLHSSFNFTVYTYSTKYELCNVANFEPEVTIHYVYTSIAHKRTYIIILKVAVGG